ncbi:MAG: hypothetical protein E7618_04130 [Ruminococcaceae bacterium]|nr:hypothetical protein [Oscillospiraceae bacterium]
MKNMRRRFFCFVVIALLLLTASCANDDNLPASSSSSAETIPQMELPPDGGFRRLPIVDGDWMTYWKAQKSIIWYDTPLVENGKTYLAYGTTPWGPGRLRDNGRFIFDEPVEVEERPRYHITAINRDGGFNLVSKNPSIGGIGGGSYSPTINSLNFHSYEEYLELIEENAAKMPSHYLEPEQLGALLGVGLPTDGSLALHPEAECYDCIYRYEKEGFRSIEIKLEYLPDGAMATTTILDSYAEIRDGYRHYPLDVIVGFSEVYFSYDDNDDLRWMKEGSCAIGTSLHVFFDDNLLYNYSSGLLNQIVLVVGDDLRVSIHVISEEDDGAPLESLKNLYDYDTLKAAAASLSAALEAARNT